MDKNLDQGHMETRKKMPLDELLDAALAAVHETQGTLQPLRGALHPDSVANYGVTLAEQRLQGVISQLEQMETLLAESAEARERTADTPDADTEDFLGWAQAGAYRAQWLLTAYENIVEWAERIQETTEPEERATQIKHAIAKLVLVKDAAESNEGYEAVTALERAIICLQELSKDAPHA